MSTAQTQAHEKPAIQWLSVWQFSLSTVAATALWSMAGSMALAGVALLYDNSFFSGDGTSLFLLATGLAFSGILLVPSAGYALLSLVGKTNVPSLSIPNIWFLRPTILLLVLAPLLLAGNWIYQNSEFAWLFLPPLHILGVGLPILWLVHLGKRNLSVGSAQRTWGVLGSGLVLSPLLILVVEIAVLVIVMAVVTIYLSSQPGLSAKLAGLVQRLSTAPPTTRMVQRILGPYLLQPGVIFSVLAIGAVIMPLIEEALKPVGVWILIGRNLSPSAGFVAGLLSGAGYALFESLAFASSAEDWALVVVARIGTGLMHILTTGLVGWALAVAWRQGRYLRLGMAYLTAVLFHGLWNGLTLLGVGYQLIPEPPQQPSFIYNLASIAPLALGVLSITMFVYLLWANSALKRAKQNEQQEAKSVL